MGFHCPIFVLWEGLPNRLLVPMIFPYSFRLLNKVLVLFGFFFHCALEVLFSGQSVKFAFWQRIAFTISPKNNSSYCHDRILFTYCNSQQIYRKWKNYLKIKYPFWQLGIRLISRFHSRTLSPDGLVQRRVSAVWECIHIGSCNFRQ